MECYSTNTTICENGKRIDNNCHHDLIHYGVVYGYVRAYYIVQLLLYNTQESIRIIAILQTVTTMIYVMQLVCSFFQL